MNKFERGAICGWLVTVAFIMILENGIGQQGMIELYRNHWTAWYWDAPIESLMFLSAGWLYLKTRAERYEEQALDEARDKLRAAFEKYAKSEGVPWPK